MSSYSEGQTHQFLDALEAKGWSAGDLTRLGQAKPEQHKAIRDVLDGRAMISYHKHTIDCDVAPFLPKTWDIHKEDQIVSAVCGKLEWDTAQVKLYLAKNQRSGELINGWQIREKLKGQPVLNACVLDYLLKHPELIPDEWKHKEVFFWGTIYRDAHGNLFVLCLRWVSKQWDWSGRWLNYDFNDSSPAAVLAA